MKLVEKAIIYKFYLIVLNDDYWVLKSIEYKFELLFSLQLGENYFNENTIYFMDKVEMNYEGNTSHGNQIRNVPKEEIWILNQFLRRYYTDHQAGNRESRQQNGHN